MQGLHTQILYGITLSARFYSLICYYNITYSLCKLGLWIYDFVHITPGMYICTHTHIHISIVCTVAWICIQLHSNAHSRVIPWWNDKILNGPMDTFNATCCWLETGNEFYWYLFRKGSWLEQRSRMMVSILDFLKVLRNG